MNVPDVLGMVLTEGIISLEKNNVLYSIESIPKRAGDETKARIIRQRIIEKSNTTELLIAYF